MKDYIEISLLDLIDNLIEEDGLLDMTDEEFEEYMKDFNKDFDSLKE